MINEYTYSNNSTFPLRNASFRKPEFRWENPGGGCTTLGGIGTFGLQEDIATNPSGISQNKHNIAQQYSERINFTSVCSLESQQVLEQGYESTGSPLPTFPQPSTVEPRHPPPPPASTPVACLTFHSSMGDGRWVLGLEVASIQPWDCSSS